MRKNRLRERWAEGRKTVNGWLAVPSAFSAELMAHQGWDSLTVDMQHGIVDYQAAVTMLQAISTTGAVPMARVPWREPGIVMKMLDAGAASGRSAPSSTAARTIPGTPTRRSC